MTNYLLEATPEILPDTRFERLYTAIHPRSDYSDITDDLDLSRGNPQ